MKLWLGLAQIEIAAFAKRNGANWLSASGRSGWSRLFNATKNTYGFLEVKI